MSTLPQNLTLEMMQPRWASILNPLLANSLNSVQILTKVSLINGVTVIPHKLGRLQQGWIITDINAAATIFRSAAFNATNLTLTSNAACVVNIGVF